MCENSQLAEGRLAAVQYLHEKGKCDISTPSNDGRKPIHAACQCGHTHVVKVCNDISFNGDTYSSRHILLSIAFTSKWMHTLQE